eukprot:10451650-Heterocapsa_arctica.AAC.1
MVCSAIVSSSSMTSLASFSDNLIAPKLASFSLSDLLCFKKSPIILIFCLTVVSFQLTSSVAILPKRTIVSPFSIGMSI